MGFSNDQYDIYISYHPAQSTQAQRFSRKLFKASIKSWINGNINSYNSRLFDQSLDAIQSSLIFVCILSKEYIKNTMCRVEFSTAVEQKLTIISLSTDDTKIDQSDPAFNIGKSIFFEFNLYELDLLGNNDEFNSVCNLLTELIEYQEKNKASYKIKIKDFYKSIANQN